MRNELHKKRADSLGLESAQRITTEPDKFGTAKLLKIYHDKKYYMKNISIWIFRVQYSDPSGYTTKKQFSFDGSFSYRDCLCKIPTVIDINKKLDQRTKYLSSYLESIRIN